MPPRELDAERIYRPFGQVAPREAPTPYMQIQFPEVRFTDAIGQALGELGKGYRVLGDSTNQVGAALAHLGGSFEHAGDEIFNRALAIKHVENQTAATEAEVKFGIEAGKMTEAFEATNGNAATGGLDAHMKSLEDVRQKVRAGLPNDEVRNMYDQNSLRRLGQNVLAAGKHAATQSKAAITSAATSQYKLDLDDAYKNPDAPDFEEKKERAIQTYRNTLRPISGDDNPTAELKEREIRSKFDAQRIGGVIRTDPERGDKMLEEARKKGGLMEADYERLDKSLDTTRRIVAGRQIAGDVNKDLWQDKTEEEMEKEPSLRDRVQQARDQAAKNPKLSQDPLFDEFLVGKVEKGYNEAIKLRKDEEFRRKTVVDRGLSGQLHPEQKVPTSQEELFAMGEDVRAAYMSLRPRDQMKVDKTLATNAKGDFADSAEARARYTHLLGEANTSSSVGQFLERNLMEEHIPWKYRRELIKMQTRKYSDQGEDPRLTHAMQMLVDVIPRSLDPHTNPDTYKQFKGAMLEGLLDFQEYNKRPANPKEIQEIGRTLLREIPKTGSFFGLGANLREFQVDPKEKEKIQRAHPDWSDDQIRSLYIKGPLFKQWQKLYGPPREVPGGE